MARPQIPKLTQKTVLGKCRRRCALCYYFDFDTSFKKGQLAHIDRNPNNNSESNLVYLCLRHHDEYDTSPSQTKKLTPEEVMDAKRDIEKSIENKVSIVFPEPQVNVQFDKTLGETKGISVEVYKLRYPIFGAFIKFILSVLQNAKVDPENLNDFRANTNDSLFLFNDEIDTFIRKVDRKAVELVYCQRKMEKPDRYDQYEWGKIVDQEADILTWFTDVFTNGRQTFYTFLKIADR